MLHARRSWAGACRPGWADEQIALKVYGVRAAIRCRLCVHDPVRPRPHSSLCAVVPIPKNVIDSSVTANED